MRSTDKRYILLLICLLLVATLPGCVGAKKARQRRAQRINEIVQKARTYTATPYKWGGTSRAGMDCSGLLLLSYRVVGLELPRTSKEQSAMGEKVTLKKLQPGDLVFFAMGKKKRKVTHAGLITVVNGEQDIRFIHASSSRGVIEANLVTDYYLKRFRGARRIL